MGKKIGKMGVGEREGTKIHRARHKEQVEEPAFGPEEAQVRGSVGGPGGAGPAYLRTTSLRVL